MSHPLLNLTKSLLCQHLFSGQSKHAQTQCKAGSRLLLSHRHCSDPKKRKRNSPILFREVVLVFAAFDLSWCFGLGLLLASFLLLSHSEPVFLLLSCGDLVGHSPSPRSHLIAHPAEPPSSTPTGMATLVLQPPCSLPSDV